MPLSPRETEILAFIAAGRTTKEVAAGLGVSVSTVEWHVSNILGKLEASSRTEAVAIAMRAGLLGPAQDVAPQERRAREGLGKDALDVLDRVLDKGIVIHAQVDVSVRGIQLIAIEGRAVVVSIDTYLRDRDRMQGSWPWPPGLEDAPSEAVTRAVEEYLRRLRPDMDSGNDQ